MWSTTGGGADQMVIPDGLTVRRSLSSERMRWEWRVTLPFSELDVQTGKEDEERGSKKTALPLVFITMEAFPLMVVSVSIGAFQMF